MMYTSDTKPEKVCVRQASGGKPIDVFIHEMIVPPDDLGDAGGAHAGTGLLEPDVRRDGRTE